jgi:DUF2075 family protein
MELTLGNLYVFGEIHQYRSGASAAGNVKCLLHGYGDILDIANQKTVLRAGAGNADNINFLEGNFDFRMVSSIEEVFELVLERNRERNKARLVAGYCWNWVSKKNPAQFDLTFPDSRLQLRWNLASYGNRWIIEPESVREVGCIHTSQGLEAEYIGVIIGPDLVARDGVLRTNPEARAKTDASLKGYRKAFKEDPQGAFARADRLIRNTYRTLLTRGQLGCYVYCTDEETREYFEERLLLAREPGNE